MTSNQLSPPPIKAKRDLQKRGLSSVLYKGHRQYGGIRKRLRMPLAAPTTPPHGTDNTAPPSIKKERRRKLAAAHKLKF